ncbi:TIGR04282 family arsenosugar biosynthesis glycosyltransferase [bacterium SCSIO 12696]|nr:TIGR04282 family arsenosugar biosynthesis glycosyltransferase [bacterium SCSIO 12696]
MTTTYLYPNYRIIQYAKAPQTGKVKTRLQPVLGEQGCLQLHCRLVEHCFQRVHNAAVAPHRFSIAGSDDNFFQSIVTSSNIEYQQGADLGERMQRTAEKALASVKGVLIIGSDCPFFDRNYLASACEALEQGNDCVLGPANDGGYVLIGLRRVDAKLFCNMPWGTEQVLALTRERLQALQWRYRELPALADIDRPDDLVHLSRVFPDWQPQGPLESSAL